MLHSWQSRITTFMQDYEIREEILNGQIYPRRAHTARENPVARAEQRCNMRQIRPQTPRPRLGPLSRAFWSSRDPLPSAAVRLPPLVRSDRVCAPLRRMWANESKSLCSLEYKIHIWPAQSVQSDIMRLPDAHTHTCSGRQKSWKERKRSIERRSCKIRRNKYRDYDILLQSFGNANMLSTTDKKSEMLDMEVNTGVILGKQNGEIFTKWRLWWKRSSIFAVEDTGRTPQQEKRGIVWRHLDFSAHDLVALFSC